MKSKLVTRPSPALVRDVIELILEYLYYLDNKFKPDSRALARYSRISRAWRLPTQILLYRQVNIRTLSDLESVEYAVSKKSQHATILKHSVRVLRIRINGAHVSKAIPPKQLPHCLRLFPYLYELRLNIQRVGEFDAAVLRDLKDTPPLQSLMIYKLPFLERTSYFNGMPESITLHFQLLQNQSWPLKYFTLCGDLNSCALSSFEPPIHKFKGIRLDIPISWYSNGTNLVSWLLRGSLQTIEHLCIPLYLPIVKKLSPRLKSFECKNSDPRHHPFLRLPQAEEVLWFLTPSVHLTRPGIPFLRMIPPMISHLGFSANHCRITQDWWRDLALVLPQTLKRVSVIQYVVILDSKQEDQRMITAELGGIEVRLFSDLSEYKASTPICMLPDKPFPHEPSLQDFASMTRLIDEVNNAVDNSGRAKKPSRTPRPSTGEPLAKPRTWR